MLTTILVIIPIIINKNQCYNIYFRSKKQTQNSTTTQPAAKFSTASTQPASQHIPVPNTPVPTPKFPFLAWGNLQRARPHLKISVFGFARRCGRSLPNPPLIAQNQHLSLITRRHRRLRFARRRPPTHPGFGGICPCCVSNRPSLPAMSVCHTRSFIAHDSGKSHRR